jgi:chorismate mutase
MLELHDLRLQIDEIDKQIVDLFLKRASVVDLVKKVKDGQLLNSAENKDFALHIKPKREYDVIQNVLSLGKNSQYSQKFFFNVWRGVIAAANFLEQNLVLASTCDVSQKSVSEYYLMQKEVALLEIGFVIEKLQKNEIHILGFHKSNVSFWQILKSAGNIKIFAECANGVFLCGKIVDLAPSAGLCGIFMRDDCLLNNQIIVNEQASVVAVKFEDICENQKHLIDKALGWVYPYQNLD